MKRIILFVFVITMIFASQAAAIPLNPTDDAFVSSLNRTTNYGTFQYLVTRAVTTAQLPTFIKFDLTGFTGFDSAMLYLFDYNSTGATALNAYTTTTSTWNETTITYANAPSRGTEFSAATISGTGWIQWDVTSFANNFAGDQLSLMLYSAGGIPTQYFYSKESPNASFMPYLEVIEKAQAPAPVPEPSSFILLGGGLAGLAVAFRRKRKE